MTTTATSTPTTAQAQIRQMVDRYLGAIRAADAEAIASFYAPDILAFDAIAELQFKGVEAYKKHWQACMEMCPGDGMGVFELHDLSIEADGDLAFGHALCRCGPSKDKAGWMRATLAFRKTDGKWTIAHEHWSAPFDPESCKALFDLKP